MILKFLCRVSLFFVLSVICQTIASEISKTFHLKEVGMTTAFEQHPYEMLTIFLLCIVISIYGVIIINKLIPNTP